MVFNMILGWTIIASLFLLGILCGMIQDDYDEWNNHEDKNY